MVWKINLSPFFVSVPAVCIFFTLLLQPPYVSAVEEGRELDPAIEWGHPPEWGGPWPKSPRITIMWPVGIPGLPYRLQLKIDGQPFDSLPIQESSGGADPYIHVLNPDLIAYMGCGRVVDVKGSENCDSVWRVLRPSKKSSSPINLADYVNRLSEPSFLGSFMGYPARLSNGNSGCIVYDWSTERYLVRWDSGSAPSEGISVQFHRSGNVVTCRQITGWKPNPDYQGGEDPQRFPLYGKEHSKQLPERSGAKQENTSGGN